MAVLMSQRCSAMAGTRASLPARSARPARAVVSRPARRAALAVVAASPSRRPTDAAAPPTSGAMELTKLEIAAASFTAPLVLGVGDAAAAGGEYGLLEGRSFALLHPIVMAGLFASTLYAGYLGLQWRRLREVSGDISAKKKELPPKGEDGTRPKSPLDGEIAALEAERKDLAAGNFRDKHNNWGSVLLGLGVTSSIGGALNTYLRVGKLFPGPHLFAGAGITVCWALAASLVPAMQKGNNTARSAHIALNTINLALFAWQLPTGWEIVLKVFQFTKWP
eukprot:jgi/Tetstr1/459021/TSEL_004489.t1